MRSIYDTLASDGSLRRVVQVDWQQRQFRVGPVADVLQLSDQLGITWPASSGQGLDQRRRDWDEFVGRHAAKDRLSTMLQPVAWCSVGEESRDG